jgi:hypothetical protein
MMIVPNVRQRVQRQASGLLRRGIAAAEGHIPVRHFMGDDGKQQHGYHQQDFHHRSRSFKNSRLTNRSSSARPEAWPFKTASCRQSSMWRYLLPGSMPSCFKSLPVR